MSKAARDIRIGTSGWHYDHWSGLFYPAGLPKNKWFEHYAQHFDTVEINNTFYQLPKHETFKNWRKQAPDDFLFTVKANRYITHVKRLKNVQEPLERFLESARLLMNNLGPILYQLPPGMHKDLDRLGAFIRLLPTKQTAVFEFRHKSWFSEDTYELLRQSNLAFCIHDMPGVPTPRVITGNVIYIRFHGATGRYEGDYPRSTLRDWARWIKQHAKEIRNVYAYFNNDARAYAVHNAKTFREQIGVL
jgi:uncharacterized protein YecE (DUF72 family)